MGRLTSGWPCTIRGRQCEALLRPSTHKHPLFLRVQLGCPSTLWPAKTHIQPLGLPNTPLLISPFGIQFSHFVASSSYSCRSHPLIAPNRHAPLLRPSHNDPSSSSFLSTFRLSFPLSLPPSLSLSLPLRMQDETPRTSAVRSESLVESNDSSVAGNCNALRKQAFKCYTTYVSRFSRRRSP